MASALFVIPPGSRVVFTDGQIETKLRGVIQCAEVYERGEVRYAVVVWTADGKREVVNVASAEIEKEDAPTKNLTIGFHE